MAASHAAAAAAPKNSPSDSRQIPSKSDSNALCKTLLLLILVLLIPLFPSQAPDFITQTVLTDFWEIIHLLFIGIAVSYGLFGRRSAQATPDRFVDSTTDDSHTYLSGISHLSSIFDDGYYNVCYEHDTMHSYVNLDDQFLGNDGYVVQSGAKIRSLTPNNGNGSVSVGSGGHVDRAWYSRHSKGESLVVLSNGKCFPGGNSGFKPLNLPVRSLRSRPLDSDNHEFENKNEFSSKTEVKGGDGVKIRGVDIGNSEFKNKNEFSPAVEAECDDYDDEVNAVKTRGVDNDIDNHEFSPEVGATSGGDDVNVVKIRGVVPTNLEKKFEEVGGRSTIPWRSRSGRMGKEEEMRSSKLHTHSRPHSVGEFEFEHLKSSSIRGSKFSASPELKTSNAERKRVFTASNSKVTPVDSEASSLDSVVNFVNRSRNSGVEEEARKGKQAVECDDTKSSSLAKAIPRAKSVRTIKPKGHTMNQKEWPNRGEGKFGRVFVKSEADNLIKMRENEPENPPADHRNQEPTHIFSLPKPKPTLPEFHNEEKQDLDGRNTTKFEDNAVELDESSDEDDTRTQFGNESELGSEVDRKADEFIAKFREQIRLQKTSSGRIS